MALYLLGDNTSEPSEIKKRKEKKRGHCPNLVAVWVTSYSHFILPTKG
jgi:hypothetical protein